jgi:hypothetical protein
MTYFRIGRSTLSSARSGFTSEFEKGSGGSRSPWSPGKLTGIASTFFAASIYTAIVEVDGGFVSTLTLTLSHIGRRMF